MINAILGQKIKQSQTFTPEGKRMAITEILTEPCFLIDVKTAKRDGYSAVILGFGTRRIKTISKALAGVYEKAGLANNPIRYLKEVRIKKDDDLKNLKPGQKIKLDEVLQTGNVIDVQGVSKGKGFQGVVKRHGFAGGPRTHGQSDRERAPGSIGQTTTPGRVYKGKRMAGRMGNQLVTIKNLKVMNIDSTQGVLTIKGVVPGAYKSLLTIKKVEN